MDEKWTKTSAAPPSGVMKPKPFSPLNHFTVPCAMLLSSTKWTAAALRLVEHRVARRTQPRDPDLAHQRGARKTSSRPRTTHRTNSPGRRARRVRRLQPPQP